VNGRYNPRARAMGGSPALVGQALPRYLLCRTSPIRQARAQVTPRPIVWHADLQNISSSPGTRYPASRTVRYGAITWSCTGRFHVSSTRFRSPPNVHCTSPNDGHDILRSFAHDRHEGCLATLHSPALAPRDQGRRLSLPARLDALN
jgi:hypothetical protein